MSEEQKKQDLDEHCEHCGGHWSGERQLRDYGLTSFEGRFQECPVAEQVLAMKSYQLDRCLRNMAQDRAGSLVWHGRTAIRDRLTAELFALVDVFELFSGDFENNIPLKEPKRPKDTVDVLLEATKDCLITGSFHSNPHFIRLWTVRAAVCHETARRIALAAKMDIPSFEEVRQSSRKDLGLT